MRQLSTSRWMRDALMRFGRMMLDALALRDFTAPIILCRDLQSPCECGSSRFTMCPFWISKKGT